MTAEIFMSKLRSSYNLRDGMVAEIESRIGRYSYNALDRLWDAFIDNYQSTHPPAWGVIYKIACDAKIGTEAGNGFYICECNAKYSMRSRGCPKCGSKKTIGTGIAKVLPDDVIHCQANCFQCKLYKSNDPADGATCDQYGRITEEAGREIFPKATCKVCLCRVCCQAESLKRRIGGNDKVNIVDKKRYTEYHESIDFMFN